MEFITSRFEPRSHKTQLVFTALAASALTAAAITSYNSYTRQQKRNELNRQVLTSVSTHSSSEHRGSDGVGRKKRGVSPPRPEQIYLNGGVDYGSREGWDENGVSASYDENLVREQLARNYAFFGEEGMEKVRGASVAVIGCGGVGSWAAVMLARSYVCSLPTLPCCAGIPNVLLWFSGVAKIRLVDFDYVTLSSLNRHAAANLADVGTPKVRCLENALRKFSRWIEVESRIKLWEKEDGGTLLEGVDWVIGRIHSVFENTLLTDVPI